MAKSTMTKTNGNGAPYPVAASAHDIEIPYVDVGKTVVIYFGGPGNVNEHPAGAGIVVSRRDAEILEVAVVRAGFNGSQNYRMAYHVESPTIRENPKLCAKEGVCLWDTVEAHEERRREADAALRERYQRDELANQKRQEARREMRKSVTARILDLYAKAMNYQEIAEAIGGGMTPNEVEAIVRRAASERAVTA